MLPAVSIVLPVHNAEATLAAAIDSCQRQTLTDFELLVVDDGSTDGSAAVAEAHSRGDARIRVLRGGSRCGVARAFQLGLAESRGGYVARMDADDLNAPRRLERQWQYLEAHREVSGVGCLVRIRKRLPDGSMQEPDGGYRRLESWLNRHVTPAAIAAQRFVDQPLVNPSMMVRRDVLSGAGAYRETGWAEDYDLWLRLLRDGHALAKVPEVLFSWVDHAVRLTRTDRLYTRDRFILCKAHFIARMARVRQGGVSICGAGPIGKALARALQAEGARVRCFYEVHPRRIGERIGGVEVEPMAAWQGNAGDVVLGAVGQPGRRGQIAGMARRRGYVEGTNFFSAA